MRALPSCSWGADFRAQRAISGACVAVLVAVPLLVAPHALYPMVVGKALAARAAIEVLAAGWALAWLGGARLRAPSSWVLEWMLASLLLSTAAAVHGVDLAHSWWSTLERMTGLWGELHLWVAVAVLAALLAEARHRDRVLLGMVVVAALVGALAVAHSAGAPLPGPLGAAGRTAATLENPSSLGAVAAMALPLVLVLRGGRSRVLWAAAALLATWALLASGSRGALLGAVAGVGVTAGLLLWWRNRALRRMAVATGGLVVVVVLLDAGTSAPLASTRLLDTSPADPGLLGRVDAVRVAGAAWLERPLLGWGPGHFGAAFDALAPAAAFGRGEVYLDHAHNAVAEELVTTGVLGTVARVGVWVALGLALLRRSPPQRGLPRAAVAGALTACVVQGMFHLDTPSIQVWWTLLVAWTVAEGTRPAPARVAVHPALRWSGSAAVVLLLVASLARLHLVPYLAARALGNPTGPRPLVEELAALQWSAARAPELATLPTARLFGRVGLHWSELSDMDRELARRALDGLIAPALRRAPRDTRLLVAIATYLQHAAPSTAGPLVERLEAIAPERPQTQALRARQAPR